MNEFTNLSVKLLALLKKVEQDQISLEPGKENQIGIIPVKKLYELLEIVEGEQKIRYIIHEMSDFTGIKFIKRDICIYSSKEGLIFYGHEFLPLLTMEGRNFLEYQLKLNDLFKNLSDNYGREILLQEYENIKLLIEHEKWMDATIKIGSILEYAITDYFRKRRDEDDEYDLTFIKKYNKNGKPLKGNVLDENTSFHKKLRFILEKEIFGREFNKDWNYVDMVIRNYRNFIHIDELVRNKIIFTKEMFEQIFPVFERLLLLF